MNTKEITTPVWVVIWHEIRKSLPSTKRGLFLQGASCSTSLRGTMRQVGQMSAHSGPHATMGFEICEGVAVGPPIGKTRIDESPIFGEIFLVKRLGYLHPEEGGPPNKDLCFTDSQASVCDY